MAADVYEVTGATLDEVNAALAADIALRSCIAFACDCRLAVNATPAVLIGDEFVIVFDFVVLSPGERPRGPGWTIFENRNGQAVGRSA